MFVIRQEQLGVMRRQRLGDALIEAFADTKQTAAWDAAAENILLTDPLGNKIRLGFDGNGFPDRVICSTGRTFQFRNNPLGQPKQLITPSGLQVEIDYDNKNRLTRIVRDKKLFFAVEYDPVTGQPCRVQMPTGPAIQLDYASPRHLAGSTDRLGRRTALEYGANWELKTLIDAAGNRTRFEYRDLNLPEKIHYPNGTVDERHFNRQGRLVSATTGGIGLAGVAYNDAGLKVKEIYSDGEVVTFAYDDAGRMTTVINPQAVVKFVYDEDGRQTVEEVNGVVVKYDYDECGFLAALTYPTGERVTFRRDAEQRVTEVTDWSGGVHRLDYRASDAGYRHARPNGVVEQITQDRLGLPKRISADSPNCNLPLFTTDYEFDEEGNLVAVGDSEFGRTRCEYDGENRLITVDADGGRVEKFTYDLADNRTSRNDVPTEYDAVNQLLRQGQTRYRYDERGNLISKIGPDGAWKYDWNARNQLIRVHTPSHQLVEFAYDGLGRRLWKRFGATTVRYNWALENLIQDETTSQGMPSLRQYLYWPVSPTPLGFRCEGKNYQVHTDHLGAPSRMTDAAGRVVWNRQPCPTAEFITRIREVPLLLRFPGQIFDEETGLYYNRNRYFLPEQGRYIHRDPVSFNAGINLYCYAANNPTSDADPLGLWTADGVLSVVGKTCGVIAGVAAGVAIAIALPGPVGIIFGGAVAGAIINGSFYLMDNSSKPLCWSCLGKSMLIGATVGAAAAVPFAFLPATAGVAAFMGVGGVSGAIGYAGDWWLNTPPGTPWSWTAFGAAVGLGAATAGLGRWLGPKVGRLLQQAGLSDHTTAPYGSASDQHVNTHGHAADGQPLTLDNRATQRAGQPVYKSKFAPGEGGQPFADEVMNHPDTQVTNQSNGRTVYENDDLGRGATGTGRNGEPVKGGTVVVENQNPSPRSNTPAGQIVTQFPSGNPQQGAGPFGVQPVVVPSDGPDSKD